MISFMIYDFGSGLPHNSIVKSVLNHRIEIMSRWGILIIINTTFSIYICYLLPYTTFTRTDGTHPLKQFSEVINSESCFTLL